VSRSSSCHVVKYLIPTREIDGFFFYMLKRRLAQAKDFEDYSASEQKESDLAMQVTIVKSAKIHYWQK
jgi:hypothetical protein